MIHLKYLCVVVSKFYLSGLTHIEATVGALVEVIHAFTSCDVESIPLATKLYVSLLLAEVGFLL